MNSSLPAPPLIVIGSLMPLLSQPRVMSNRGEEVADGDVGVDLGALGAVELADLEEVVADAAVDGHLGPGVVHVELSSPSEPLTMIRSRPR